MFGRDNFEAFHKHVPSMIPVATIEDVEGTIVICRLKYSSGVKF